MPGSATPLRLELHAGSASISELVIACPDTCRRVELAAFGGKPPYNFSWDDGPTDTSRNVCPVSDATLHAKVRDALGSEQSATLGVRKLACAVGRVCADNASLEGMATLGLEWLSTGALSASNWADCRPPTGGAAANLPRVVAAGSGDEFPAASDGDTYLYVPSRGSNHASVSQTLCGPLSRGSTYAFKVDLAYAAEDRNGAPLEPGQLQLYAASDSCQRDELLWSSPPLRTAWRTYCVAFTPQKTANTWIFNAIGPAGADAAVFIDHIVPVTGCP